MSENIEKVEKLENQNPILVPIKAEDELKYLKQVAADDNHTVLYPTHLVKRAGAIIGYASVCKTPVVQWWAHSEKMKARDSLTIQTQLEAVLRNAGLSNYVMPCAENSPYFDKMEKLGYIKLGNQTLFFKDLNK